MLYFTTLPDHRAAGFNERAHFDAFRQQNIVFNALARKSQCDRHVGCLSIKTVLSGEEIYGVNGSRKSVRPGQFLVLNNDQPYSSRIDPAVGKVKSLSVFFAQDFASAVFRDAEKSDTSLLDSPFEIATGVPEFFQTLYSLEEPTRKILGGLVRALEAKEGEGEASPSADEYLVLLLYDLLRVYRSTVVRSHSVEALKPATRKEIYKRLCVAKDLMHSDFMNTIDLSTIGKLACLSTPQLIRQFKAVFQKTPHQYLAQIRLGHGATLLKHSTLAVNDIALASGFQNTSAFCRAFKASYHVTPLSFRATKT